MCIFRDLFIENMGFSLSLYHNDLKILKQRLEFVHFSVNNIEKCIFFRNSEL